MYLDRFLSVAISLYCSTSFLPFGSMFCHIWRRIGSLRKLEKSLPFLGHLSCQVLQDPKVFFSDLSFCMTLKKAGPFQEYIEFFAVGSANGFERLPLYFTIWTCPHHPHPLGGLVMGNSVPQVVRGR